MTIFKRETTYGGVQTFFHGGDVHENHHFEKEKQRLRGTKCFEWRNFMHFIGSDATKILISKYYVMIISCSI